MKIIVSIAILFAATGIAAFLYEPLGLYPCSGYKIQKATNTSFAQLSRSPSGQTILNVADRQIMQGTLRAEDRDILIRTHLEKTIRQDLGCPVPQELEEKSVALFATNNPDGKECKKDMFDQKARTIIGKLKQTLPYPKYEKRQLQKILDGAQTLEEKDMMQENLKNPVFRDEAIIALKKIELRRSHGCANVMLPLISMTEKLN